MSLERVLAKFGKPVTPVTSTETADVTREPTPQGNCTSVTPVTSEKTNLEQNADVNPAVRTLYVIKVDDVSFIYVDVTGEPLAHVRQAMEAKYGDRVKSVELKGDGPLTGSVCDLPDCPFCRRARR